MVKKKIARVKKLVKDSKKKNSDKHKVDSKKFPTLKLVNDREIALDFALKVSARFDKICKAIVLFGSSAKKEAVTGSDIDIIIIIDDATIVWDQELIAWYREELGKILRNNVYDKTLHINTIKLTTWWEDLMKGDPVVLNVIRYGITLVDIGGFFDPLKALLMKGKIKATPEAVYNALERAPMHLARSKNSELSSIEGLYWCVVDASHAALISAGETPPSPEHIAESLQTIFVAEGKLKPQYVGWFRDLMVLHKDIAHGQVRDLKGIDIDLWQERAEDFLNTMVKLVKEIIE